MTDSNTPSGKFHGCEGCPWFAMHGTDFFDLSEIANQIADTFTGLVFDPTLPRGDTHIDPELDAAILGGQVESVDEFRAGIIASVTAAASDGIDETRFNASITMCPGPREESHFKLLGIGLGRKVIRCMNPAIPETDTFDPYVPGRQESWMYAPRKSK